MVHADMTYPSAAPSCEKVEVLIKKDSEDLSKLVADRIAQRINDKAQAGKQCVLGLATGSSPTQVYKWLVHRHKQGQLSFRNVKTFNLDEYCGLQPNDLQSYHHFMNVHLFDHLSDIDRANIHIPDGTLTSADDILKFCEGYEAAIDRAGGIDVQLLGMGRMGHIGFNESGSGRDTQTRAVYLDRVTRVDAASDFFGEQHVPKKAITMGVATILQAKEILLSAFGENKTSTAGKAVDEPAKEILLLAFGENKTSTVVKAVQGPVTSAVPASFLQEHPNVHFFLDEAASAGLTRVKSPWLLGEVPWNAKLQKQAVIWLAQSLEKSILKLTAEDYTANSLQELCETCGPAELLNVRVFKSLQDATTDCPGGQASAHLPAGDADSSGAEPVGPALPNGAASVDWQGSARAAAKRILVMSPHPDDDVISMGGALARLCQQGHEVHVAYQTSGCIAVHDHDALRHLDFMHHLSAAYGASNTDIGHDHRRMRQFVQLRKPGQVDDPFLQKVKTLIRYTEARSAAGVCSVPYENCHFLDMPFYETGTVAKKDLSDRDIQIIVDLFRQQRPHQIYAAGDLSDPHGTHRTCLKAIFRAIDTVKSEDWFQHTKVYLYRGAWQEWEPYEADMAVPMTRSDLSLKIDAIFRHQSQKDRALFPGADPREFWQRARDRNEATASLYDLLGLPEHYAMELFVEYKP